MVLSPENSCDSLNLSPKLDNQHHHLHRQSEASSDSLQAFRSDVNNILSQLSWNSKPGSEFLSLSWIQQCLEVLPSLNKAFAKLVVDIDYPMSRWDDASNEEYLNYSLKLLELLNAISSSLSHLGRARLAISHALSLLESSPISAMEHLREIQLLKSLNKDLKLEDMGKREQRDCSAGKEGVVHQALMVMKSNGYWVCGVVLTCLSGDIKPYLDVKKAAGGFLSPSIIALDLSFYEVAMDKEGAVLKEVKAVTDGATCLVDDMAAAGESKGAGNLERELQVMQCLLDAIGKEAGGIFSEILAGRAELLDRLRQHI